MSSLRDERLRVIHRNFVEAGEQYPYIHFAAATPHWAFPDWPVLPIGSETHWGLPIPEWKRILYVDPRRLPPYEPDIWLKDDNDRLWVGFFYHEFALRDDYDDRPCDFDQFYPALDRFRDIASHAAGHFPRPTPHSMLDFPLRRDPYYRWLEWLIRMPWVESDDREIVLIKRVPGDIFTASARAIEELETRQGGSFSNVKSPDARIALRGPQIDHLSTVLPTSDFKFHGIKEAIAVKTLREQEQAFLNCRVPISPKACEASHHKLMKMIHDRAERFTQFDPSVPERWARAQAEAQTSLVREASVKLGVEPKEILDGDIARGIELILRGTARDKEGNDKQAAVRLLSIFTSGLTDDRFEKAAEILENDMATVNDKLKKIDAVIPFPPIASAQQLGILLGVSKQAVMKTEWWIENRKGEKENEIGRRRGKHLERSKQRERDRANDRDQ